MSENKSNISWLNSFLIETGELAYFTGRFFKEVFRRPFEFKEFLKQCYNVGNKSLLLVGITGFIIGLVFTLQSRPKMMELGAEGVFVGSGIFKSGNPAKRAAAIVQAVTNYNDPKKLAELSEDLGEAMVGINEEEISVLMAERGK